MRDEKKHQISKEVDVGARLIGADIDDGVGPSHFDVSKFGVCNDCSSLKAATTQYGKTFAQCYEFEMILNGTDPIVTCTKYDKRGSMKLWEMKDIAIILEPHRKQAGFITED
jgi:hypothetical protein